MKRKGASGKPLLLGVLAGLLAWVPMAGALVWWSCTGADSALGFGALVVWAIPLGAVLCLHRRLNRLGVVLLGLGFGTIMGIGVFFAQSYVSWKECVVFEEQWSHDPRFVLKDPQLTLAWWTLPAWVFGAELVGVTLAIAGRDLANRLRGPHKGTPW